MILSSLDAWCSIYSSYELYLRRAPSSLCPQIGVVEALLAPLLLVRLLALAPLRAKPVFRDIGETL
jgi:hypothetical protein